MMGGCVCDGWMDVCDGWMGVCDGWMNVCVMGG